jgi:alpha-N-acetylglucosaminidase
MDEPLPVVHKPDLGGAEPIAQWSPDQLTTDWQTREWSIPAAKLATLDAVVFTYAGGNHRLEIQEVAVVADGKVAATDRHFGYAGKPDSRPIYQLKVPVGTTANNGCVIRASVKGGGGTDSKGTVGLITRKP